jgi:hypothetical protein
VCAVLNRKTEGGTGGNVVVLVCTVRLVDRRTEGDTLGLIRTVCSVAQTERRKEDAVGTMIAVLDRRTEGRIRGAVYCSVHVMSVTH